MLLSFGKSYIPTATGGTDDDFSQIDITNIMATFAVGASDGLTANISLILLNDDFVEGPETFIIYISNVTSTALVYVGNKTSDTVTINDNDGKYTKCYSQKSDFVHTVSFHLQRQQ